MLIVYSILKWKFLNSNYDIYLSLSTPSDFTNNGITLTAVAWPSNSVAPARGTQDGKIVRSANPNQLLVGVV
jgi:hypothetical protein